MHATPQEVSAQSREFEYFVRKVAFEAGYSAFRLVADNKPSALKHKAPELELVGVGRAACFNAFIAAFDIVHNGVGACDWHIFLGHCAMSANALRAKLEKNGQAQQHLPPA